MERVEVLGGVVRPRCADEVKLGHELTNDSYWYVNPDTIRHIVHLVASKL